MRRTDDRDFSRVCLAMSFRVRYSDRPIVSLNKKIHQRSRSAIRNTSWPLYSDYPRLDADFDCDKYKHFSIHPELFSTEYTKS